MAYLPTRKQIGDSCILVSSCIILNHLTSIAIEDLDLRNHPLMTMVQNYGPIIDIGEGILFTKY